MYRGLLTIVLLVGAGIAHSAGQTLRPDLEKVSKAVVAYVQTQKPDWRHETALPPTPTGSQPSPDVAIHFWSSEKCVVAELIIDGMNTGKHPVSCRIKLAIDQSESSSAARARLANFVREERSATVISVGDKAYVWNRGDIVFIKGKFTFWLGGGLDLRVGDFTNNAAFMEKLARQIADVVVISISGQSDKQNDEFDSEILEIVFRYQISQCAENGSPYVFVLSVQGYSG